MSSVVMPARPESAGDAQEQDWDIDPDNPFNWSIAKKWRIMGISCLLTFLAGLNATAITTAFVEIGAAFSVRDDGFEYIFFTVTAWNFAAAVFPMLSLPVMDTYGTYLMYAGCHILLLLFVVPQAVAQSFATLVVTRVFAGAFGGTLQNAAEAVAANLFKTSQERLLPVTVYIFALVGGVTLGPVQGAVVATTSWRWIFWMEVILYGATLPLTLFALSETRGSVIQARKQKTKAKTLVIASNEEQSGQIDSAGTAASVDIVETIGRSVKLLTTEPTVFFFMLWCAFSFGLIFISTESATQVFTTSFDFEAYQAGLVQISMFVGELIGLILCLISNVYYARSASSKSSSQSASTHDSQSHKSTREYGGLPPSTIHQREVRDSQPTEGNGKPFPEKALHLSIPATVIFLSGGLFVYAWTSYPSMPWIAPAIGLAMQGLAVQVIIFAATVYITDSYERFAASAIGGIAFGENTFAAFLPLASLPMYTKLGFEWASSLLAFVALLLAGAPLVLAWKGRSIRERSKAIKEMAWT